MVVNFLAVFFSAKYDLFKMSGQIEFALFGPDYRSIF